MSAKFIVIWNVCWILAAPVVFWLAFRAGRRWRVKNYVKGLLQHLRRTNKEK